MGNSGLLFYVSVRNVKVRMKIEKKKHIHIRVYVTHMNLMCRKNTVLLPCTAKKLVLCSKITQPESNKHAAKPNVFVSHKHTVLFLSQKFTAIKSVRAFFTTHIYPQFIIYS